MNIQSTLFICMAILLYLGCEPSPEHRRCDYRLFIDEVAEFSRNKDVMGAYVSKGVPFHLIKESTYFEDSFRTKDICIYKYWINPIYISVIINLRTGNYYIADTDDLAARYIFPSKEDEDDISQLQAFLMQENIVFNCPEQVNDLIRHTFHFVMAEGTDYNTMPEYVALMLKLFSQKEDGRDSSYVRLYQIMEKIGTQERNLVAQGCAVFYHFMNAVPVTLWVKRDNPMDFGIEYEKPGYVNSPITTEISGAERLS